MLKIIVALRQEINTLSGYDVYYSGCGKVNATIATMEAISSGAKTIINYGTAGAVRNLSGLIEPTGFVDRDMDVRPLGFELGQTPFEEGIRIGHRGVIIGSGDTFAISKPNIECDLVDMEAYAIARVCKKYDIKFRCLKYITDNADDSSGSSWEEKVGNGAILFQEWLKSNDYMPLQQAAQQQ